MEYFKNIIKNIKKLDLNIVLFLLTIFLISFLNNTYTNKITISTVENRGLKTKPVFSIKSLFSGEFIKDYEDYYSDNFMYRDKLIGFNRNLKKLKGIPTEDEAAIVSVSREKETSEDMNKVNPSVSNNTSPNENSPNSAPVSETPASNTSDASSHEDEGNVVKSNYIILGNSAIEIHNYDESLYTKYAEAVNDLKQSIGSNINMYSLIVPTAFEFMNNSKYKELGDPEIKGIDRVNNTLLPEIKRVDSYNALKNNSDEYIFYRSDIHWTALGAYFGYTAFMNSKGEAPIPLEEYSEGKIENYLGTLYGATLSKKLAEAPDTLYYYKPIVDYKFYDSSKAKREILDFNAAELYDKYCLFLGGLRMRGEITSSIESDKDLLIIKDSFGNTLIPFLIPHYKKIYIVDPRACDINIKEFVKSNNIEDVLVINNVFSITKYDFPDLISKLSK